MILVYVYVCVCLYFVDEDQEEGHTNLLQTPLWQIQFNSGQVDTVATAPI